MPILETRAAGHSLVAAIHREADAAPGSPQVEALRRTQARLWKSAAPELHREFNQLGAHLAATAPTMGGLVLESKGGVNDRVELIIAAAGLGVWVATRFKPIYERLYRKTAIVTMQALQRTGVPVTERDKVEARLLLESGRRMGLVNVSKQAKESLFAVIDTGRELGLGPRATAELIRDLVPKGRYVNAGSTYRSELIARTEMMHAQRIGSIESYKRSRVVKECICFDGDSDSICLARNGTRMSFESAEQEAKSTHPGCVLVFGPALA